jgi:glycerophosphoryl diester phosphodiesterase
MLPQRVLFGHRGAPLDLPENTLEGFRHALDIGVHALEVDVHCTRDGHAVIAHDPTVRRMAGAGGTIAELTMAELRRLNVGKNFRDRNGLALSAEFRMPTFMDALRTFPDAFFNVDLKSASAIAPVLRVLDETQASNRVLLTSFSSFTLSKLRRAGYCGLIGAGALETLGFRFFPQRLLGAVPKVGGKLPARLQVPLQAHGVRFANAALLAKCRALHVPIDYWVVNERSVATRLLALGASGLVSDDPALILPAFNATTCRPGVVTF